MKQEFIIMDASVKYMDTKNPLEEGLLYDGEKWAGRDLTKAYKYASSDLAVTKAKELLKEGLVKVYLIQINGPQIGFAEVKF